MNRSFALTAAAFFMLSAGAALADHCDVDLADAEAALAASTTAEVNVLDAADALIELAIGVCDAEEEVLANAEIGSPMLEPDFVTVGQSMLVNAAQLADTE